MGHVTAGTPGAHRTPQMQPGMDVQTRQDRSVFSLLLQTAVRPFKPKLVAPSEVFPAGSNQLKPLKKLVKIVRVVERQQHDMYVYDITRKAGDSAAKARVRMYYFAGGGWQMPPSSQHWKFCAELVRRVPGLAVSVVSTPLAPNSPAAVALPQLGSFCAAVLDQAAQAGERIVFGGDSSGGNLALALALQGVMKDGASPDALLVVSPAVDLRPMEAEGPLEQVSRKDAVLTIEGHEKEAEAWSKDSDRSDALISPITADMGLLAKAGCRVIGVTGGYDILTPDAIKLRDRCQQSGVDGAWLHWEKQMHCFPLAFMYRLPEGVQSKEWIVEQLSRL